MAIAKPLLAKGSFSDGTQNRLQPLGPSSLIGLIVTCMAGRPNHLFFLMSTNKVLTRELSSTGVNVDDCFSVEDDNSKEKRREPIEVQLLFPLNGKRCLIWRASFPFVPYSLFFFFFIPFFPFSQQFFFLKEKAQKYYWFNFDKYLFVLKFLF